MQKTAENSKETPDSIGAALRTIEQEAKMKRLEKSLKIHEAVTGVEQIEGVENVEDEEEEEDHEEVVKEICTEIVPINNTIDN